MLVRANDWHFSWQLYHRKLFHNPPKSEVNLLFKKKYPALDRLGISYMEQVPYNIK